MNTNFIIDWKFVAAIGATAVGIIIATKMDSKTIENVTNHFTDKVNEKNFIK